MFFTTTVQIEYKFDDNDIFALMSDCEKTMSVITIIARLDTNKQKNEKKQFSSFQIVQDKHDFTVD